MKNPYDYYIEKIKPIEKKYSRICILYAIFKLPCLKNKKTFYNNILINYYKMLQDNTKDLEEIINKFNK